MALLLTLLMRAPLADATPGDVGYQDGSYTGSGVAPTADKPQSKLWFNDGSWWADMFDTDTQSWHIFKLDRSTEVWSDTGVQIDDRPSTRGDTLWDGTYLYVASNVMATSSATSAQNKPARLYRYRYSGGVYALDTGFPVNINNVSSESLTLDKDSSGVLWTTWTQAQTVYANSTTGPGADASWGTPFTLGSTGSSGLASDDLSSIAAFGRTRVALMWSNQNTSAFYFAVHRDGDPRTTWTTRVARNDPGIADDHINLKQLEGDDAGHLYAAVKTSLDSTGDSAAAQNMLLGYSLTTGTWESAVFGTVADCHTRPMIVIDTTNKVLHMFATGPSTTSGCPGSGTPGTIYEKTTPLTGLSFPAGRGTPVIRDAASANMNNVTGTKQNITATSGMIVLASNDKTERYWHADVPLTGAPGPTVAFTASPTSGTAPLTVAFTDGSSSDVTSWSWNFGDGATSTTKNPSHTYTAAGTYTVTLTGSTAAGASKTATGTIQVTTSPPPTGTITYGGTAATGQATAGTSITLSKPSGTVAGDVLIASFTADNAPTATAPSGWTSITRLAPGGATIFAYYHVVTSADTSTASWRWTLNSAQKWSGGIDRYQNVDNGSPLASTVTTKVSSSGGTITVPAVSTTAVNAVIVGGMGADSGKVTGTQPSGWTEAHENATGQLSESAYSPAKPSTGSQGTTTWTQSGTVPAAAWTIALRPKLA